MLLIVKAAPGMKIPLAHSHKQSIPEGRIIQVEDSHYYRSMITDGDLIEATDDEWQEQQKADAIAEADAIAADKKAKDVAAKAAKASAKSGDSAAATN